MIPMHTRLPIQRLAMIVGLVTLCACNTAPSINSAGIATCLPTQTLPLIGATDNSSEAAQIAPTPTRDIVTITAQLHCTIYAESRWGAGPGELGFCPPSSAAWVRGPYPPVVNADGDIFIVDKANQRIVKYSEGRVSQIIPLPSSYMIDFKCPPVNEDMCNRSRWSNVSISGDRLFLQFSILRSERIVSQLAVLSPEGQEQRIIDLEPYYPQDDSPFLDSVVSDRRGGVYLLLMAGLVHIDAAFRPTFIGASRLILEDPEVGWDGNFYTYEQPDDCVRKWGDDDRAIIHSEPITTIRNIIATTQLESPTYTRFLGVDTQGRLYFRTRDAAQMWLVRVSASGEERVIAPVPEEWSSISSLGPDGTLYGITYDLEDISTAPRVIQCMFE